MTTYRATNKYLKCDNDVSKKTKIIKNTSRKQICDIVYN